MFFVLFCLAACQQAGEGPIPTTVIFHVTLEEPEPLPDPIFRAFTPDPISSLYTAIIPIGEIEAWTLNCDLRRERYEKQVLEEVHYRFDDSDETFVTVNRFVFALPTKPRVQDVHVTFFKDGGANLTHKGETYVAMDYIRPQHFRVEEAPNLQLPSLRGPSL